MATQTTNYNLEKPEATDPFGDFRQSYNSNMDIIDANLGGGGGGGNVYGAFVDPSHIIKSQTVFVGSTSYTATEDCFVVLSLTTRYNASALIKIDGVTVQSAYLSNGTNALGLLVGVKKGQTLSVSDADNNNNSAYTVYGVTEGTNGIFTPVIYSDNERVIGVWRNNKPLYAKTVSFTTGNTSGYLNYLTDIENPETMMIDFGGSFYVTGTARVPAMAYFGTLDALADTNAFAILCNNDSNHLRLDYRVGTSAYSKTAYVTVLYTKTTDVAGSGNWNTDGVPTVHYDDTEKVIGTYLGKPLYQITYSGLSLVCTNANQSYATNIDWGNIKKIVHSDIIDQYGQSCAGSVVYTGTPAKLAVYMQMANCTVTDITIQYTKTTD